MRLALVTIALMGSVGIAIAVLPNTPAEDRLAVVSEIGKSGEARLEPPAAPAPSASETPYRTFSFPIVFAGTDADSAGQPQRSERTGAAASPPTSPAVSETVVVSAPRAGAGDQPQPLTLAVQTELRRLGCYAGALDGDWGRASMQGLRAFLDEAGTTLPVGKPDYVTLTLLRGYTDRICGEGCPSGRRSPATGACLSGPTLETRAIKRPTEHDQDTDRSRHPPVADAPAARRPDAVSSGISVLATRRSTSTSGWTTTTVETVPVLVQGPSRVSDPRNAPPLEGRMAVGGPTSTLTVVPPTQSSPFSTTSLQMLPASPAAGQQPTGQNQSRTASRPNRSLATSRHRTNWTATFFDR
jgi:hypothetical protein